MQRFALQNWSFASRWNTACRTFNCQYLVNKKILTQKIFETC